MSWLANGQPMVSQWSALGGQVPKAHSVTPCSVSPRFKTLARRPIDAAAAAADDDDDDDDDDDGVDSGDDHGDGFGDV
ncbi:hypothetical protein ElyMa_005076300 [Elysia marginata]|uniref:Uncharacterized protein n=1 Tax=Elysia marginata TaxID=1093978 RepID=A0AAV4JHJ3_9GAST|nr:hypothetical protein ElyMa_005076300 [Elysia marginata]